MKFRNISLIQKTVIVYLLLGSNISFGAMADRMDSAILARVPNEFMGSVLVERNGQTLLNKGYGNANLEWDIPNSPMTKFRIASITKQFTAAAILMLAERNALNIHDKIVIYLEDIPDPWRDITIFHLLAHTSGLSESLPLNFNEARNNHANVPLDFTPGEQHKYSNIGYIVLGKIIEETSGQSYQDFVKENIFEKLEMNDTGYGVRSSLITSRASGYQRNEEVLVNAEFTDMSELMAAGGMHSTTEDLHRWNRALYTGEILSNSSVTQMTTAYKEYFGFGTFVETISGNRKFWHNGSIQGFSSLSAYYPDMDATVIVLSNIGGALNDALVRELEYILLDMDVVLPSEWVEVSLSENDLAEFVGTYEYKEGLQMKFWVEDGKLISDTTGGEVLPLTPSENLVFYPQTPYIRWEFKRNSDGEIDRLEYYQRGQKFTLTRQ